MHLVQFHKNKLQSSINTLSCIQDIKKEWVYVSKLYLDYQTFYKYEPYFVRLMKIEHNEKVLPLLSSVIQSFLCDVLSLNFQYSFFSDQELQSLIHSMDAFFSSYSHVLEILQSKTNSSLSSSLWNSFVPSISKEDFYKKEILEYKRIF